MKNILYIIEDEKLIKPNIWHDNMPDMSTLSKKLENSASPDSEKLISKPAEVQKKVDKQMDSNDRTETRDIINDKIAAADARNDTKFAVIEGKIDLMKSEILRAIEANRSEFKELPTKRDMRNNNLQIFVALATFLGLLYTATALTENRYIGILERIPLASPAIPSSQSSAEH